MISYNVFHGGISDLYQKISWYITVAIKMSDRFIDDITSVIIIFTGFWGRRRIAFCVGFFSSYPLVLISHGLGMVAQPHKSDCAAFSLSFVLLKFDFVLQISVNSLLMRSGLCMLLKFVLQVQKFREFQELCSVRRKIF